MNDQTVFFRRNLPHIQPEHSTFFITFRLASSVPHETILRLKEEQALAEHSLRSTIEDTDKRVLAIAQQRKRYFGKFDSLLDGASYGNVWLKDSRIARIVSDALHYHDGKEYNLLCFCIMPNHVHLVFSVGEYSHQYKGKFGHLLSPILFSLKRFTAREGNKILCRNGSFWQHESYDHIVRDEWELHRIINYVLENPVKARLVKQWNEWKWSYVKTM
ncbi:MAG: hypothetical protein EPO24_07970 [Bacteroidetes bacterium]|nr:MAG: hypothetical protein EPO24_07970 [Bacteroidota bacterium]